MLVLATHVHGGLGNRLFQTCFLYALAKRHGVHFHYSQWQHPSPHSQNVYPDLMQRFMEDPLYIERLPANAHTTDHHEKGDDFMSYTEAWDHIVQDANQSNNQPTVLFFHGFFQTERFFAPYESQIRLHLREPINVTRKIDAKYNHILPSLETSVFVHVRLGDYVQNFLYKHFVDLNAYYRRCISDVQARAPGTTFVLVCNDQANLYKYYAPLLQTLASTKWVSFNEPDELLNLYLMARCQVGGICSNSTYSWWASWLGSAENKRVYMPSRWIKGPAHHGIYPHNAIVVPTD